MRTDPLSKSARRSWRLAARFAADKRGLAAVEFAFIVPLMLTLIFGTIDVSSGVAIDRKVTLVARTVSDLASQGTKVSTIDLTNFFKLGTAIMTPYPITTDNNMTQSITAINVDASKKLKVMWSYSAVANGANVTLKKEDETKVVTSVPPGLLVPNTQLIWSEVKYTYKPIVGYLMSGAIPLKDECYTRPRQSNEVAGPTS